MSKFILVCSLIFSIQIHAKVKCSNGAEFSDSVVIQDDNNNKIELGLNGVGLKQVLFFKVFYMAFYLENLSQNPELIIQSDEHKVGIIHALRNIAKKRLVDMWEDEFKRLCEKRCDEMRPYHEEFLSYARNVKKNERLYLINFPDRFEFEIDHKEFFKPIYSPEYGRLLQNSLFGPDAADASLKKGILGEKQVCKAT